MNGDVRQDANTSDMVYSVRKLIAYALSFYTLLPGDVIYTGSPEGVGPVKPATSCWPNARRSAPWK